MVLIAQVTEAFDYLGISPDTPQDVAKSTYKKLALAHHPDRNHGDASATQRFQQIGAAWQTCLRHYENPRLSQVPPKTKGPQHHGPYDGRSYSADEDVPLDEEEAEMFFRFMFEEMLHNRYSYAKGQHYRQQRHGAYGDGMFTFSGGFAESQKRQEDNAERLRKENEAYQQRVRELDAEIAAEERERERIAREQNKAHAQHISAQLLAFQTGRAGDGAGMRSVVQELSLDVNAPEKQKSNTQHKPKIGEEVNFETMLHVAAASCDPDTVAFLIRRGADPTALSPARLTPFHVAILRSNTPVVRFFLERHQANPKAAGCHPSKSAPDGRTPLQLAIASAKPDMELVRLVLKDATVHDVVKCWEQAEMGLRSAGEGAVAADGSKWRAIKDVLLTKKGFLPPSEDPNAYMSKKEIKTREAEEKARRRAEDEARAVENSKRKREKAEKRAREENEKRAREEEVRLQEERARAEVEAQRRKALEEAQRRDETEKARRRAEEQRAQEAIRIAEMEAQAGRKRQADREARRQMEIARREAEVEEERERKAAEEKRNQKEVAAARRAEREERLRAEREQRVRAEQEEAMRIEREAAAERAQREAELEVECVLQQEEERLIAANKAREEARMRRRAEQSARDKARNQRIREERDRERAKMLEAAHSQANGVHTSAFSPHSRPDPRIPHRSPPQQASLAYPTPSSSFSHTPPSKPPPIPQHTRPTAESSPHQHHSRFAPPSPPMTEDVQTRAIPDDLFPYEPPVPKVVNSVSPPPTSYPRERELDPHMSRGQGFSPRGRGRGGRGRGRGAEDRGRGARGRGRGGGSRAALEAEVARKDLELQQLRAQLAAAHGKIS